MSEQPQTGNTPKEVRSLGTKWGIASAITYIVLAGAIAFVSGNTDEDAISIIGFGIFLGFVNAVTCGSLFVGMPPNRLKLRHWVAVTAIAALCGYGATACLHSVPASGSFSAGFVVVGLPLGYLSLKSWVTRWRGPKGHPDNISY